VIEAAEKDKDELDVYRYTCMHNRQRQSQVRGQKNNPSTRTSTNQGLS